MNKEVIKVGDRVRAIRNIAGRPIKDVLGTVRVAYRLRGSYHGVEFDKNIGGHDLLELSKPEYKKGNCLFVHEKDLVKVEKPSIHITVDGTTTNAVLKEGNKVVKRSVAKCSPNDEFDFKTGAKIAMDRLLGEEIKGDCVTDVREVSRKARVGEYIKIVKKGNHGPILVVGDIHKVVRYDSDDDIATDKGNLFVDSETHEYVVLENYNPEKPVSAEPTQPQDELLSYKKVKRQAEVGEYMLVVNAGYVPGDDYKNGDILKCISVDFGESRYAYGSINSTRRVIFNREYVVLEGYQPPMTFDSSTENTFTKEEVLKAVEKALEK